MTTNTKVCATRLAVMVIGQTVATIFSFNKQKQIFCCSSIAGECSHVAFAVKLNVIRAHFESLWLLAMQLLPYN